MRAVLNAQSVNPKLWLPLVAVFVAHTARADGPRLAGGVAVGAVFGSTGVAAHDLEVSDDGGLRVAAEGLLGLRFGRTAIGVRAGLASPVGLHTMPVANSGEIVPTTGVSVYPIDLGPSVQIDAGHSVWFSLWGGATLSISHARSPAADISAIGYTGHIPSASWTTTGVGLGYGAALGYDFAAAAHGHLAAMVIAESQTITAIPERNEDGSHGSLGRDLTCWSVTIGVAYRR
jgi:hypothetical protein